MTWQRTVRIVLAAVALAAALTSPAAAGPPGTPSAPQAWKFYFIKSVGSSKFLDLQYINKENHNMVAQWDYWGGLTQQWQLIPSGTGFKLCNRYSGKVMDVWAARTDDGAPIQQYTSGANPNQVFWPVVADPSGSYMIYTFVSNKVLDVPGFSTRNGTVIQQYTRNWGSNQRWLFYLAP